MSIEVVRRDPADLGDWNDLLERSPHATPFHLAEALHALAAHSSAQLHPLVGYKGDQPVGLFPVFEQQKGPLTMAFSPPPDQKVDYLGPVLLDTANLKRRRLDKRNMRFVDACLDWLEAELGHRYLNLRTSFHYDDPRPFDWRKLDHRTKYTYVIDLDCDMDTLFEAFSGDARRGIRNVRDTDREVDVSVGDAADARRILDQLRDRLDAVGGSLRVSNAFVDDLYESLPADVVRPYVATVDGEFHGGILTLESHGTVYAWQGGAKTDGDLDLNDYLDWTIIRDAIDRGNQYYDLVGAESQRLCWYKAKFGPRLAPYNIVQQSSPGVDALASIYKRIRS